MKTEVGALEFFSVNELVTSFPGSSRKLWLGTLIPRLRADKVLVKVGRKFVGRRSQIEAAIVGAGEWGAL